MRPQPGGVWHHGGLCAGPSTASHTTPPAGYVLLPDSYLAPLREIVRKRMHDLEVQVKIDGRQCTLSLPEIMRRGSHMIYVFKVGCPGVVLARDVVGQRDIEAPTRATLGQGAVA